MTEKKPTTFSTKIDIYLADKMQQDLLDQGFDITRPNYTIFSAKKPGLSCTLYESGKLVVQGKNLHEFMEFYIEPYILKDFSFTHETPLDNSPRIGSDEAGKGDFFGPLCVAAVFAEGDMVKRLKKIGVRDSKGMNDKKIIELAKSIEKEFPHHIVKINPSKYNELYAKFSNLNNLLAWAHSAAIMNLVDETGCEKVIVDQFAAEFVMDRAMKGKHPGIELIQRHRAEEDVVVAAGSILARKTFVEGIAALGKQYGMTFPKGGGKQTLEVGREFVSRFGAEELSQVCKLHFKNRDAILQ
ncbi:MAG: Ribonuclease HIII [Chlamydiae bacterium]|nr:Ribonuclease HIII [Chlamydiota bacterium]